MVTLSPLCPVNIQESLVTKPSREGGLVIEKVEDWVQDEDNIHEM